MPDALEMTCVPRRSFNEGGLFSGLKCLPRRPVRRSCNEDGSSSERRLACRGDLSAVAISEGGNSPERRRVRVGPAAAKLARAKTGLYSYGIAGRNIAEYAKSAT